MTEEEFREKVLPLRHLMYGLALRMGMDSDDAADAVQETQIRLWHRRSGIPKPQAEIRLYCMASMRNECLTRIRLRHESVSLDTIEHSDSQADHCDMVEFADMKSNIEGLLSRLPAAQRQAVRLSAFAELDTREIANAMGQTENNVRQLLSRGRKRLREMMEANCQ